MELIQIIRHQDIWTEKKYGENKRVKEGETKIKEYTLEFRITLAITD